MKSVDEAERTLHQAISADLSLCLCFQGFGFFCRFHSVEGDTN